MHEFQRPELFKECLETFFVRQHLKVTLAFFSYFAEIHN